MTIDGSCSLCAMPDSGCLLGYTGTAPVTAVGY